MVKALYIEGNHILSTLELEPLQIIFATIAVVIAFRMIHNFLSAISQLTFGKIKTKIFRAA